MDEGEIVFVEARSRRFTCNRIVSSSQLDIYAYIVRHFASIRATDPGGGVHKCSVTGRQGIRHRPRVLVNSASHNLGKGRADF